MGATINITQEIIEIFQSSQVTAATHQKNGILLKKLVERVDIDVFFNACQHPLNSILNTDFKHRHVYVEKLIDFFASFCVLLKPKEVITADNEVEFEEHPLFVKLFDYLVETSQNVSDTVRFRSCQIINKILDHLIGMNISEEFCENIKSALLLRIKDPKNVIRLQAIIGLFRLQDPTDPHDDIIEEFIHIINTDAFAKVRQLCVEKIAARRDVVPYIIARARDSDVNVRLAAYKRLAKFAEYLKIADKQLILKCGLADSSPKVKDFVSNNFIESWLSYYDGDILKLLESIRLDADETDISETTYLVENVLDALFKSRGLKDLSCVLIYDEKKLIPQKDLNWESSIFWRKYVELLTSREEFYEHLEDTVPELVDLCKYILSFCKNTVSSLSLAEFLERQFIIKQLFIFTKTYDFADPSRRQSLNYLVCKVLEGTELISDVTRVIISTLELTIPDVEYRARYVNEIISELISPMNSKEAERKHQELTKQVSNLKENIQLLLNEQKNAIENAQYEEADRIKHQMDTMNKSIQELKNTLEKPEKPQKRSDIPTLVKCIDISCGFLLSSQVTKLVPSVISMKDSIIHDMLMHDNDSIRSKALHCYSLCCILDKATARNGIHIFSTPISAYRAGEECDTQTLIVCIGAVVDLLRVYGTQLMAEPNDDVLSESMDEEHERVFTGGTSLTDLVQGLVDLMDDEQSEVQKTAGLGLCKLVLSERIHSSALISRLILRWCTPASDDCDSDGLKQCIGFVLEQIPLLPESSDQLEGAVLLTIKALVCAPKKSPLADVNIENIVKFMLALCKTSPEGQKIHINLAKKICAHLKDKPQNSLNQIYSKMLLLLEIPDDEMIIQDFIKLCDEIKEDIREKTALNNVTKFAGNLTFKRPNSVFAVKLEQIKSEISTDIQFSQEV